MATIDEQYALVAQLGLIEGIRAGLLQDLGGSASPASQAAIAALVTTPVADATDLPTALTLVNELKTKVNQIISALQA